MQHWLLGVDAGGSRTQAVLWKYGTEEMLTAESGSGNPWAVGPHFAADAIEEACARVLALGGLHLHDVSSAVLGIAGYGRSGAPEGFEERIEVWGLPAASVITSDLEIATVAGLGERSGVHVVAGTGSALMVQTRSGERIPLGGWGWFLGDPGSAFDLGWRALRWWAARSDGDPTRSDLAGKLAEWAGAESPRELQARFANPGVERPWIASGARVVLKLAERGDEDALAILDQSMEGLLESLRSAARRLASEGNLKLSCSGGMFRSAIFTNFFQTRLEKCDLEFESVNIISNPIEGAIRIAQKSLQLPDFHNLRGVIALHFA